MAAVVEWVSGKVFRLVHQNNLVYNTCWEDPRLDRAALELGPEHTVLVITSAGCNTLDYALTGPQHIYAVDMNPRQNALLELKIAGIRALDFETFYEMFGNGRLPGIRPIYEQKLRPLLTPWSRRWWDRHIDFFAHPKLTFYFRGTAGTFARMMNAYADRVLRLRPWINAFLEAQTLEEQREIYFKHLRPKAFTRTVRFLMRRDAVLSLLGVPRAQREQVEEIYPGGIIEYIEHCLDAVFGELPFSDNYFWRVYLTGHYTPTCCPEYLKRENFEALKAGLVDRISIHTDTVEGFLAKHEVGINRFVLLDHMDWLWSKHFPVLESEWQWIVRRALPGTRLIWRSGALRTDFVDRVQVRMGTETCRMGDLLRYHRELADKLHRQCRVHTYASFHIADLQL